MCLKFCACHEKSEARSYEVLHLSRKIILANLKIPYSKMQPFSGNLRPDLLTSLLTDHVSCILFNVPRVPKFLKLLRELQILLTFTRVQNPLHLRHKTTVQRPKAAQTCGVCSIFTSKRASRQNAVHFLNIAIPKSAPALRCFWHFDFEMCFAPQRRALFNISTSKSAPTLKCVVHFDLEICFAPKQRALFPHHSFQKCSDVEVFLAPQRRAIFISQMAPHPPL